MKTQQRFSGWRTLLLLLASSHAFATGAYSQSDDPWELFSADSAAMIVVERPEEVAGFFESSGLADNDHIKRVQDLLTHREFGRMHATRFEHCQELLSAIGDQLNKIEELVFVIHSFRGPSELEWTMLVRAPEETRQRLLELSRDLYRQLELAKIPRAENPTGTPLIDDAALGVDMGQAGVWFYATNSAYENLEELNRMGASSRKFSQSRRFHRVRSHFADARRPSPAAWAIGNPSRLRPFFPDYDDDRWEALKTQELPSFGLAIHLGSSRRDGTANLVAEGLITLTQPPTAVSKYIAAYREFDMPPLAFDPVFFNAEAFDPIERDAAQQEIYTNQFPEKDYLESRAPRHDFDKRDHRTEAVPRTDLQIRMVGKDEKPQPGQSETFWVHAERIRDAKAMTGYVTKLAVLTNAFRPEKDKIVPISNDYGDAFAVNAIPSRPGIDSTGFREQSYLLTDKWYLTGSYPDMLRWAEALESGRSESGKNVAQAMAELSQEVKLISKPNRVQYSQPYTNRVFYSQFENARLEAKHGRNFIALNAARKRKPNRFGERLLIESQDDADALIKQHLGLAMAQYFGHQLFVLCRKDGLVQLSGALFPDPEK